MLKQCQLAGRMCGVRVNRDPRVPLGLFSLVCESHRLCFLRNNAPHPKRMGSHWQDWQSVHPPVRHLSMLAWSLSFCLFSFLLFSLSFSPHFPPRVPRCRMLIQNASACWDPDQNPKSMGLKTIAVTGSVNIGLKWCALTGVCILAIIRLQTGHIHSEFRMKAFLLWSYLLWSCFCTDVLRMKEIHSTLILFNISQ